MIGFIIWSICAVIFFGIGISCRKAEEAVGFFTFAKPPAVGDVKGYNHAVSALWMVSAGVFEIMGIPLLVLKQNSPFFIFLIFAVLVWVIALMIAYVKIEGKYTKK